MQENSVKKTDSEDSESINATRHSKRGVALALPAQACRLIVSFGSICILSRLLTPDDFGVAGMVLSITGFLELFKDGGLGMALVRMKEVAAGVVHTLFWIVAATSVTLGLMMFFSGPLLASLYREPRIEGLVGMLSLAIVFNGMAVIPQALMRRELKFGQLAIIDIVAPIVALVIAITCAFTGFQHQTLAIQPLVFALATMIMSWCFRPVWPGMPHWSSEAKEALFFGVNLSGYGFVNYWARNLDKVLIGRYCGAFELGVYVRAYALLTTQLNFIITPLSSVYVPILSRFQATPDLLRRHFLDAVSLVTSISLPISAALFVCADEVVAILLGPEWPEVVMIFRLLCISAPFQYCSNTTGWLYAAIGRTDRQARWGVFQTTLIVLSFFMGLPWGSRGVALSYSLVMIPLTFANVWYAAIGTAITTMDFLRACLPSVLYSLGLCVVLIAVKYFCATHIDHVWGQRIVILGAAAIGVGFSVGKRFLGSKFPPRKLKAVNDPVVTS